MRSKRRSKVSLCDTSCCGRSSCAVGRNCWHCFWHCFCSPSLCGGLPEYEEGCGNQSIGRTIGHAARAFLQAEACRSGRGHCHNYRTVGSGTPFLFFQAEAWAPFLSAGANRLWGFGPLIGAAAFVPFFWRFDWKSQLHCMSLVGCFLVNCHSVVPGEALGPASLVLKMGLEPTLPGLHKVHQADLLGLANNFSRVPFGLDFLRWVAAGDEQVAAGFVACKGVVGCKGLALGDRMLDLARVRLFGGFRLVAGHDLLPRSKCHATRRQGTRHQKPCISTQWIGVPNMERNLSSTPRRRCGRHGCLVPAYLVSADSRKDRFWNLFGKGAFCSETMAQLLPSVSLTMHGCCSPYWFWVASLDRMVFSSWIRRPTSWLTRRGPKGSESILIFLQRTHVWSVWRCCWHCCCSSSLCCGWSKGRMWNSIRGRLEAISLWKIWKCCMSSLASFGLWSVLRLLCRSSGASTWRLGCTARASLDASLSISSVLCWTPTCCWTCSWRCSRRSRNCFFLNLSCWSGGWSDSSWLRSRGWSCRAWAGKLQDPATDRLGSAGWCCTVCFELVAFALVYFMLWIGLFSRWPLCRSSP